MPKDLATILAQANFERRMIPGVGERTVWLPGPDFAEWLASQVEEQGRSAEARGVDTSRPTSLDAIYSASELESWGLRLDAATDRGLAPNLETLENIGQMSVQVVRPAMFRRRRAESTPNPLRVPYSRRNIEQSGNLDARASINVETPIPLRPYQEYAVERVLDQEGTLIADDPRMGKTAQALSVINAADGDLRRTLIVSPGTVKDNWKREADYWLDPKLGVRTVVVEGPDAWRQVPAQGPVAAIVHYEQLRPAIHPGGKPWASDIFNRVRDQPWDYVVLDEIQMIKNPEALQSIGVLGGTYEVGTKQELAEGRGEEREAEAIQGEKRLALTGTVPLEKNPAQLYPVLRWLQPDIWGDTEEDAQTFANRYVQFDQSARNPNRVNKTPRGSRNFQELQDLLRSNTMIRRIDRSPPAQETVINLQPESRDEWEAVQLAEAEIDEFVGEQAREQGISKAEYRSLLESENKPIPIPFHRISAIATRTAKAKAPSVAEHIVDRARQEPVLAYTSHLAALDAIGDRLDQAGIEYFKLHGGISPKERAELVKRFNEGERQVLLSTISSYNSGLATSRANLVVFGGLDWRAAEYRQAKSRIRMPEKTEPVRVEVLLLDRSIDGNMIQRLDEKSEQERRVVGLGAGSHATRPAELVELQEAREQEVERSWATDAEDMTPRRQAAPPPNVSQKMLNYVERDIAGFNGTARWSAEDLADIQEWNELKATDFRRFILDKGPRHGELLGDMGGLINAFEEDYANFIWRRGGPKMGAFYNEYLRDKPGAVRSYGGPPLDYDLLEKQSAPLPPQEDAPPTYGGPPLDQEEAPPPAYVIPDTFQQGLQQMEDWDTDKLEAFQGYYDEHRAENPNDRDMVNIIEGFEGEYQAGTDDISAWTLPQVEAAADADTGMETPVFDAMDAPDVTETVEQPAPRPRRLGSATDKLGLAPTMSSADRATQWDDEKAEGFRMWVDDYVQEGRYTDMDRLVADFDAIWRELVGDDNSIAESIPIYGDSPRPLSRLDKFRQGLQARCEVPGPSADSPAVESAAADEGMSRLDRFRQGLGQPAETEVVDETGNAETPFVNLTARLQSDRAPVDEDIYTAPDIAPMDEPVAREREIIEPVGPMDEGERDEPLYDPTVSVQGRRTERNDDCPLPDGDACVTMMSPRDLKTDAGTFQYKVDTDAEGISVKLQDVKKWDADLAGIAYVWERADGQRFVVDGHQRHALAMRMEAMGQDPQLLVKYWREVDGYTPRYMKLMAAKKNVAEGSGTAVDAARILREDPNLFDTLSPSNAIVRDAKGLAKLDPTVFNATVEHINAGNLPENVAAVISRVGSDPTIQRGVLQELVKEQREKRLTIGEAGELVSMVRRTMLDEQGEKMQGSLEGFDIGSVRDSAWRERSALLEGVLRDFRNTRFVLRAVGKGETKLEDLGNVLAQSANAEELDQSSTSIAILEVLADSKGPLADFLDVQAKRMRERMDKEGVSQRKALDAFKGQSVDYLKPFLETYLQDNGDALRQDLIAKGFKDVAEQESFQTDQSPERVGVVTRRVANAPPSILLQDLKKGAITPQDAGLTLMFTDPTTGYEYYANSDKVLELGNSAPIMRHNPGAEDPATAWANPLTAALPDEFAKTLAETRRRPAEPVAPAQTATPPEPRRSELHPAVDLSAEQVRAQNMLDAAQWNVQHPERTERLATRREALEDVQARIDQHTGEGPPATWEVPDRLDALDDHDFGDDEEYRRLTNRFHDLYGLEEEARLGMRNERISPEARRAWQDRYLEIRKEMGETRDQLDEHSDKLLEARGTTHDQSEMDDETRRALVESGMDPDDVEGVPVYDYDKAMTRTVAAVERGEISREAFFGEDPATPDEPAAAEEPAPDMGMFMRPMTEADSQRIGAAGEDVDEEGRELTPQARWERDAERAQAEAETPAVEAPPVETEPVESEAEARVRAMALEEDTEPAPVPATATPALSAEPAWIGAEEVRVHSPNEPNWMNLAPAPEWMRDPERVGELNTALSKAYADKGYHAILFGPNRDYIKVTGRDSGVENPGPLPESVMALAPPGASFDAGDWTGTAKDYYAKKQGTAQGEPAPSMVTEEPEEDQNAINARVNLSTLKHGLSLGRGEYASINPVEVERYANRVKSDMEAGYLSPEQVEEANTALAEAESKLEAGRAKRVANPRMRQRQERELVKMANALADPRRASQEKQLLQMVLDNYVAAHPATQQLVKEIIESNVASGRKGNWRQMQEVIDGPREAPIETAPPSLDDETQLTENQREMLRQEVGDTSADSGEVVQEDARLTESQREMLRQEVDDTPAETLDSSQYTESQQEMLREEVEDEPTGTIDTSQYTESQQEMLREEVEDEPTGAVDTAQLTEGQREMLREEMDDAPPQAPVADTQAMTEGQQDMGDMGDDDDDESPVEFIDQNDPGQKLMAMEMEPTALDSPDLDAGLNLLESSEDREADAEAAAEAEGKGPGKEISVPTLLDQLSPMPDTPKGSGAGRLKAMINARDFVIGGENADSVQFRFSGSRKWNRAHIKLEADDTYTVQFIKLGRNVADMVTSEPMTNVYAEQLPDLFERETGVLVNAGKSFRRAPREQAPIVEAVTETQAESVQVEDMPMDAPVEQPVQEVAAEEAPVREKRGRQKAPVAASSQEFPPEATPERQKLRDQLVRAQLQYLAAQRMGDVALANKLDKRADGLELRLWDAGSRFDRDDVKLDEGSVPEAVPVTATVKETATPYQADQTPQRQKKGRTPQRFKEKSGYAPRRSRRMAGGMPAEIKRFARRARS